MCVTPSLYIGLTFVLVLFLSSVFILFSRFHRSAGPYMVFQFFPSFRNSPFSVQIFPPQTCCRPRLKKHLVSASSFIFEVACVSHPCKKWPRLLTGAFVRIRSSVDRRFRFVSKACFSCFSFAIGQPRWININRSTRNAW